MKCLRISWSDPVDINRSGIIPFLTFVAMWAAAMSVTLFATIWIYSFQEVPTRQDTATQVAVAQARLRANQILAPAVAVVKAMEAAIRSGAVAEMTDFLPIQRTLLPHFAATPWLHEVEVAENSTRGSILIRPPLRDGGSGQLVITNGTNESSTFGFGVSKVEFQTDDSTCSSVAGICSAEPLRAITANWFRQGFGIGANGLFIFPESFWHGPIFLRAKPHEVACAPLCFYPAYAYVGNARSAEAELAARGGDNTGVIIIEAETEMESSTTPTVTGKFVANATSTTRTTTTETVTETVGAPLQPLQVNFSDANITLAVLVKAAIDASALMPAIDAAERLSGGEVVLCTAIGEILALRRMSEALTWDPKTGEVRAKVMWDLDRDWARLVTRTFIEEADWSKSVQASRHRVTVFRVDGAGNLGLRLRIIVAMPSLTLADPVLGGVVTYMVLTVSAVPFVVLFCMAGRMVIRRGKPTRPPGELEEERPGEPPPAPPESQLDLSHTTTAQTTDLAVR